MRDGFTVTTDDGSARGREGVGGEDVHVSAAEPAKGPGPSEAPYSLPRPWTHLLSTLLLLDAP